MMIVYLCDCKKECFMRPGCHKSGSEVGFCKHTTDPNYAKNGVCADPQNHPERFSSVLDNDSGVVMYYFEKEAGE